MPWWAWTLILYFGVLPVVILVAIEVLYLPNRPMRLARRKLRRARHHVEIWMLRSWLTTPGPFGTPSPLERAIDDVRREEWLEQRTA